jgi:N-acetyl sugar amidotransferase
MNEPLEIKYGLPADVKFCNKCVMSNQRPNSAIEAKHTAGTKKDTIAFEGNGVCIACKYHERKEKTIDWEKREKELSALCNRFRKDDGSYDCIIPGSGGKDSAYTAYVLKYEFGMHPLTVTWSPLSYTETGWRNFRKWCEKFDNVLITPKIEVRKLLVKLAFLNLCHPFQPFMLSRKYSGPKEAILRNIKLIFGGENPSEYGNKLKDNENPQMNFNFFTDIDTENMFISGIHIKELMEKFGLSQNDLSPYLPPKKEDIERLELEYHHLGYYRKWDPQEMYYRAVENIGFEANESGRRDGTYSKYGSLDDKLDDLQFYATFIKFGIGKATYDASQEIRNNKITREEGLMLVKKFDGEFPKTYHKEVLDFMGITEEDFWKTIDNARSPHLWKYENGGWKLRHAVWMEN